MLRLADNTEGIMDRTPEIIPLETSHLPNLNALFTKVFAVERCPEIWVWKYFRNPHGDPVASVALTGSEVVGFYGLLPRKIRIGDRVTTAYQEVDLMVDPDHGGGGLFKKLGRTSYDRIRDRRHPVTFTFGFPNQTSLPLGRRILGWRAIRPIPLWTILLNPKLTIRERLPGIPLAGDMANWGFRQYHAFRLRHRYPGSIRETETIPSGIESSALEYNRQFAFIRDRDYLTWRYQQHPGVTYRHFVAASGDRIDATLTVGITDSGRANICECLLPLPWNRRSLSALVAHAADICRKAGCYSLRCWALEGSPEGQVLKKMGFSGRNALNFHVIRSFEQPEFNRYLFDADRWFVSAGDSDCV